MLSYESLRALEMLLRSTVVSEFMRTSPWAWVVCESLHFVGMSLLAGTVGLFDLRLLGFLRSVPLLALHRLIPIGVAGFLLNASTAPASSAMSIDTGSNARNLWCETHPPQTFHVDFRIQWVPSPQ